MPQVTRPARARLLPAPVRCSAGRRAELALRLAVSVALVICALSEISFGQAAGEYRIDPQSSRIEIRVFRGGFLRALGDDHRIALQRFTGTAEGDPARGWKIDVNAQASSLEVLDPDASTSTRAEVQETMLGPTQMDVARFPSIELKARTLKPGGEKQSWILQGELTVHGVTRREEFPVRWSLAGGNLRVQGKKDLLLRDFKIEPIRKGLGAVKVRNQFEVDYDIVLHRVANSSRGNNSYRISTPRIQRTGQTGQIH